MRKFQPLHRRLNSLQRKPANHNFMCCEIQLEPLFFAISFEFCEDELIERQQEGVPR